MYKNLRWKILTILAVFVVFFGIGVYPLLAQRPTSCRCPAWLMAKQLKLGLDLKGGVHLVMRVNTDDALQADDDVDERAAARVADAPPASPSAASPCVSPTTFRVDGVPPDRTRSSGTSADEIAGDQLRPQPARRRRPTSSR